MGDEQAPATLSLFQAPVVAGGDSCKLQAAGGLIYEVQWLLCGCPLLTKEEDSLDSLIHLSWHVRAAWMREGGRVERKEKWMDVTSC